MMSILRRGFLTIVVLLVAVATMPTAGRADGPDVGGYLGAAFPLKHYNDFVDTGGVIGGWGGYRWNLADSVALSVVGNPQFTLLPTDSCPARALGSCDDDDVASEFSISVGPKLTLMDGPAEFSLAVLGGYYNDISGPFDEDGGGLAVHGTIAGNIGSGVRLGVFGRFEQQWLASRFVRRCPGCGIDQTDDRQMVMVGISVGWTPDEEVPPAPPVAVRPVPASAAPAPVKRRFVLRGVNFDFNKANIRADAAPVLDEAIRALRDAPSAGVVVEGHTDSVGTDAYNQRLSERRAAAVRDYLIRGGVAPTRLQAVGFGESRPVASNDTADGRAQNRRAELNVQ
jgi:outer membrane protein OmpA-like peptidoglycan-associated protein